MPLIARRPFLVADRRVLPGEPVPEAAAWATLPRLLLVGWIEDVPAAAPDDGRPAGPRRGAGTRAAGADGPPKGRP